MIVKITFNNNKIMLFGNSYKPWHIQFDEYIYNKDIKPIKFESCPDKWIGWGGLKWCNIENFQHQLNREGCQSEGNDNPNPRKLENMIFVYNNFVKNKALKILRNGGC